MFIKLWMTDGKIYIVYTTILPNQINNTDDNFYCLNIWLDTVSCGRNPSFMDDTATTT